MKTFRVIIDVKKKEPPRRDGSMNLTLCLKFIYLLYA